MKNKRWENLTNDERQDLDNRDKFNYCFSIDKALKQSGVSETDFKKPWYLYAFIYSHLINAFVMEMTGRNCFIESCKYKMSNNIELDNLFCFVSGNFHCGAFYAKNVDISFYSCLPKKLRYGNLALNQ